MEPMEVALRNYRNLSPVNYLQSTHDARVYDVAFDGETLFLVSEAWVSMDPLDPDPGQGFRPIFSRYRAVFHGVEGFQLETVEPLDFPGTPRLADFVQGMITDFKVTLSGITIKTDDHEMRFSCRSFDVQRFEPM